MASMQSINNNNVSSIVCFMLSSINNNRDAFKINLLHRRHPPAINFRSATGCCCWARHLRANVVLYTHLTLPQHPCHAIDFPLNVVFQRHLMITMTPNRYPKWTTPSTAIPRRPDTKRSLTSFTIQVMRDKEYSILLYLYV